MGWRTILLAAALAAASPGCCDGDDSADNPLLARNSTPYFVHLLLTDAVHLWIAPYADTSVMVGGSTSLTVVIAPGQGATGRYETSLACCDNDCGSVTLRWDSRALVGSYDGHHECGEGSCPYVYADDGERFALRGEALAGALNRGAPRDDLVPLEALRAREGRYRVRLGAELREDDYYDDVALRLVDHPPDVDVVADAGGELHGVAGAAAPARATDASGTDRTALLAADDGDAWESVDLAATLDGGTRDWVVAEFPRPRGAAEALLVLRGRNTRLLQDAYHEYMRRLGPGVRKLMRATSTWPPYRPIVDGLLGGPAFAMDVSVETESGWAPAGKVGPIGPAGPRTIALRLALPAGAAETVRVRLAVLPGTWSVEQARLGVPADAELHVADVPPAGSVLEGPGAAEAARGGVVDAPGAGGGTVRVPFGHALTVLFDAPPIDQRVERTAFLRVTGYYEELDSTRMPCIRWRQLAADVLQPNAFARFVLWRLARREALRHVAAAVGVAAP